jgi:uncharacterized Zn-binding protein involved in type VI secretion
MPGVTRDGDATTTGHGCDATTTVTGPSTDVFCNGKGVERLGDPTVSHDTPAGLGCVAHTSSISAGSGTVFTNGKPTARIGDACDGGAITGGSGNVFAGG